MTDFQADTFDIYINEKKDVIFTCKVNSNISIGEEDVAVYDDIKFIAYMNDNGINGDTVANDGVYSAKATLSSSEFALVEYYATAFGSNSNIFEINFYRDLTPEELCYNKSIILDNDIKSLENIMSVCKESNKKFGIDASNAFANSMFLFTGGLEPMGFENDGFTQKFNNYNIDEVASSVYAFANLFKKYEPYFENNSSDNLVKQLDNGTVAAGFIGSWDISKAQAALGENAGFAILPTINIDGKDTQIKCFYEYDYLGVNSSSDFPVSSQILAYYLSNSNSQQARAEKLNFSSTNINVIDSNYVKGHPALTSIVNQSYSSINFNAISYIFWDPCEQEIGEYITDFNNDFSYNAIKLQVQNTITNILD